MLTDERKSGCILMALGHVYVTFAELRNALLVGFVFKLSGFKF